MKRQRQLQRILASALALGLLLALTANPNSLSVRASDPARPRASFDADIYADLAIGVPYEDVTTIADAGAVNVIYGASTNGLTATGDQIWHQDSAGLVDVCETSDIFGTALAVGDFNGDGYVDLAIGVPYEDVGTVSNAGAVHVIYGASGGLSTIDEMWHQDSPYIEGGCETGDWFGSALAAGDFNGDGYDDLAIGVPAEDVGTLNSAGAVNVIYGTASGLIASGDQLWTQNSVGILDVAEADDQFGYSLAAGDFDRDGYDDLAIGVVHEDAGTLANAGAVNVIYGSLVGLTDVGGDEFWTQSTAGILNACEADDVFGWALAAGDFDGDGYTDLAIGVPGEDHNGKNDVGAVNVIYGSANGGLTEVGDQFWHQDVSGTQNGAEPGDRFGRVLTTGDFNGDGRDDLAVGLPYEDNGSTLDTGAVHVLYGAVGGLTEVSDWCFFQSTTGILDTSEQYDYFGRALAAGDFDGDGYTDLAIGVPYEDVGAIGDAGAVNVVYGSASGLTTDDDQFWHQDSPYIEGGCETGDRFGYALAAFYRVRNECFYLPLILKNHT